VRRAVFDAQHPVLQGIPVTPSVAVGQMLPHELPSQFGEQFGSCVTGLAAQTPLTLQLPSPRFTLVSRVSFGPSFRDAAS
jgi:hypothetical protein